MSIAPAATAGYAAVDVTVADRGRVIVAGLTLSLAPASWIAVTGANNADLSHILAVLSGRRPRSAGTITLDGHPMPAAPIPAQVGYVGHDHRLVGTLTAAETLMAGLLAAGHREPEAMLRRAEKQLQALDLPTATWHNLVEQLSGGQRQRVAIAQALVSRPRLLVVDDPTSELDPDSAVLVASVVEQAVKRGACCLITSTDPELLHRCSRNLHISGGRGALRGTAVRPA